jgi:hypothetical protein
MATAEKNLTMTASLDFGMRAPLNVAVTLFAARLRRCMQAVSALAAARIR